jgi:hypothetical protein
MVLLPGFCAEAGRAGLEKVEPRIPIGSAQSGMAGHHLPAALAGAGIIIPEQAVGYRTKRGRRQRPMAAALRSFSRGAHTIMRRQRRRNENVSENHVIYPAVAARIP